MRTQKRHWRVNFERSLILPYYYWIFRNKQSSFLSKQLIFAKPHRYTQIYWQRSLTHTHTQSHTHLAPHTNTHKHTHNHTHIQKHTHGHTTHESMGKCSNTISIYYWENVHCENVAGKMSDGIISDGKMSDGKHCQLGNCQGTIETTLPCFFKEILVYILISGDTNCKWTILSRFPKNITI